MAASPEWHDLSRWQHFFLWSFNLPFYDALREREFAKIYASPSVKATFNQATLHVTPLDQIYQRRYFLKRAANSIAGGYPINFISRGSVTYTIKRSQVLLEWLDKDPQVWENFSDLIGDQSAISLKFLAEKLNQAHLSTLSDADVSRYWSAFR